MSFADDLRNAKAIQEKEEKMQVVKDWDKLIDKLYDWLKEKCQQAAKWGHNYINEDIVNYFGEHVDIIDNEWKWEWDTYEDEDWCERILYRFFAKQYPYSSRGGSPCICFSEEDYKDISLQLTSRLQADGLSVQIKERKVEIYRQEVEHKEYKGAEKTLAGIFSILDDRISKDGYQEKKNVFDHYRYQFYIKISW